MSNNFLFSDFPIKLADSPVNDRSFGLQVPLLLIATFLCWQKLPDNLGGRKVKSNSFDKSLGSLSKLAKLDFLGSFLLAMFILLLLLPMELGGKKIPWSHPIVPGLLMAAGILLAFFIIVEKRWAKDPVLDLNLFKQRDVVLCLLIATLQSAAQLGVRITRMLTSIPLTRGMLLKRF